MSKPVWSKSRPTGITGDPADDGPHRTLVYACAPVAHVQGLPSIGEPTTHLKPGTSCDARRYPEWDHPLLVPLPDHPHGSGVEVEVPKVYGAQFPNTNTRRVEQLDHRPIALRAWVAIVRLDRSNVHDPHRLLRIEDGRESR